jgi:hypothetical protein
MNWYGQLAERLKALAWKASWRETVTGVRLPHCPPFFLPPQRNCLKTHYVFPQDQKSNLISEINRLILNPLNLQISDISNELVIEEKVEDSLDLAAAEQIALEFEKAVQANRDVNGYRILPAGDSLTVQRVKVIG